ncbi:hypothetical protein Pint_28913 [Pistacia integerrima]|uniref:Uncharacterized protein n=1 Tax=Pistacia integerrima TaxID=434235 RepID=A0ACC0X2S1_9ROSI|nr:hypothetical protein Pint_28913 [Pistacia integerrima]
MHFCQSFMNEICIYLGPDKDLPSEEMGVGTREMGISLGNIDILLVILRYLKTLERACLNMPSIPLAVNILTKANVLVAPAMADGAGRVCSLLPQPQGI